jgi:phosphatidylserine decarboxylase
MKLSHLSIVFLFYVLVVLVVNFYRKPLVQIIRKNNTNRVYFPAFGTVKKIERIEGNRLFIAIFLSPLDIHYQYMPVQGVIRDIKHDDEGVYHLAFDMEKSRFNEKMIYTIETKHGELILYQIAGFLVRRIVTDLHVDQTVETGEQVGMIKFGSRVDLILPNADRFLLHPGCAVGASVTPEDLIGTY